MQVSRSPTDGRSNIPMYCSLNLSLTPLALQFRVCFSTFTFAFGLVVNSENSGLLASIVSSFVVIVKFSILFNVFLPLIMVISSNPNIFLNQFSPGLAPPFWLY